MNANQKQIEDKMKPEYLVTAYGTCSDNFSDGLRIEGLSLGFIQEFVFGASAARTKGKELEIDLIARASKNSSNVKTYSKITRQKKI